MQRLDAMSLLNIECTATSLKTAHKRSQHEQLGPGHTAPTATYQMTALTYYTAYLSISPNTTSSVPITVTTSANMNLLVRKSVV